MHRKKSTYTVEEAQGAMEKFCAYQERCHQEVRRKLKQMGMIQEASDHIQLHLYQNDFINEERFARSFSRGKFRIKKWGRVRIKRELIQREISSMNIRAGLEEIDGDDYEETLSELATKRYDLVTESHFMKKRKKVADYLLRKGFESSMVYSKLLELEGRDKT